MTAQALQTLQDAGCITLAFNPIWRWRRRGPLLCRDHRKVAVIDQHVGYCGGMNISEDYAGDRHGRGTFLDCHLRMQGPCVQDLAHIFRSSLAHVVDPIESPLLGIGSVRSAGPTFVQVLGSSGFRGRRTVQRAVRATIRRALKRCWITTPYFVPPLRLARAIVRAAKRGVDVQILTPGSCDVPIVRMAAQHVYSQFLEHGVRIFELQDCMLHAKTMTIDGLYSTVGSFNLDHWSDKHNLEVNVGMIDPEIASELERQFSTHVASAKEITLDMLKRRRFWQRISHWLMYQFLRL
jgi:cardiolipin synthase